MNRAGQLVSLVLTTACFCVASIGTSQVNLTDEQEIVTQKRNTVEKFFQQFRGMQIEYTMGPKRSKGTCWVQREGGGRNILELAFPSELKALQFEETLIQKNFQMIQGYQTFSGENLEKSERPGLNGSLDWRKADPLLQFNLFWMGHFWDGQEYVDVTASRFWESVIESDVDGDLVVKSRSGGSVRFGFETIGDPIRLDRVVVRFQDPAESDKQGRNGNRMFMEMSLRHEGKGGAFSSWTLFSGTSKEAADGGTKIDLVSIRKSAAEKNPFTFQRLRVDDGTSVRILTKKSNIRFEYRQGLIQKVVDKTSLSIIEELLRQATGHEMGGIAGSPEPNFVPTGRWNILRLFWFIGRGHRLEIDFGARWTDGSLLVSCKVRPPTIEHVTERESST